MADLPVGMTQLMHLNAFSADLAMSLQSSSSISSGPWSGRTFSHYADARRRTAPHPDDLPSSPRPPLALPQRDASGRRAARQAAAARARRARAPSEADSASLTSSGIDDEGELYGILRKRGRKTRMPRRRMFVLRDAVLYNFKTKAARRPTWKLSLPGAVVGLDPRTLRIVLVLDGDRTLVLYADTPEQARDWTEALAAAAEGNCGGCCFDTDATLQNVAEVTDMQSFTGARDRLNMPRNPSSRSMGLEIPDMAREVPENDNWDSFRSFAALQIKTGRGVEDGTMPQHQPSRMKYSRPRVYA